MGYASLESKGDDKMGEGEGKIYVIAWSSLRDNSLRFTFMAEHLADTDGKLLTPKQVI